MEQPYPSALAGSPQALRPALFNIKAPLRAKDFEKIRNARASYRVPAPSRASHKFRVSAASPPPLFLPQGFKGQICHFAPCSWVLAEEKKSGTQGRKIRDLFVGLVHWAPLLLQDTPFCPSSFPGNLDSLPKPLGGGASGSHFRPVRSALPYALPPRVCASLQARRASYAATRTWPAASCSGAR